MVKKGKSRRLSAGELEILQVLWRDGPVTISEARHGLRRTIGYTTVQTRLNRLAEKGVITRTTERPAKYQAAVAPEEVSTSYFKLLLERVSGGSIVPLVAHLMKDRELRRGRDCRAAEADHRIGTRQRNQRDTRRHAMNGVALGLLAALLRTTGFLGGATIIVRLVLHVGRPASPAVHRATWLLVLLTGWFWWRLPVAIPYHEMAARQQPASAVRAVEEQPPGQYWADAGREASAESIAAASPPPPRRLPADGGPGAVLRATWPVTILGAWLSGMFVVVMVWIAQYFGSLRQLRAAGPAEEAWVRNGTICARAAAFRQPFRFGPRRTWARCSAVRPGLPLGRAGRVVAATDAGRTD